MFLRALADLLFPPRDGERLMREVTPDIFTGLMRPERMTITRPETVVLLPYRHEHVRATIHEAKYHRSRAAHALLAASLSEYLAEAAEEEALAREPYVLIPMPLSRERYRERGYNQIEEVIRAAELPGNMASRTDVLIKSRHTPVQTRLPRTKRLGNQHGAFSAHGVRTDAAYILVDDVLTTGATMQAAIDALHAAGAKRVIPLALAH